MTNRYESIDLNDSSSIGTDEFGKMYKETEFIKTKLKKEL